MTAVCETILAQLGGNKFVAMTGAKNFVRSGGGRTLTFDLPKGAKNKSNRVAINHTDVDDYTVIFYKWNARDLTLVCLHDHVYPFVQAAQLREVFTRATGLEVAL